MNRGPLVGQWTFLQFAVLYLMPVYPKTGECFAGPAYCQLTQSESEARSYPLILSQLDAGSAKKGRLSDSIGSSELVRNLAMNLGEWRKSSPSSKGSE
jgi:hypothetical protein